MIWFTSDQHFGHENIIKYCNRPFASVDQMNFELVRRHNAVVKDDDIVFHLGDFSMHPRMLFILSLLKGVHYLVAGNHDRCHPANRNSVTKQAEIRKLYFDAAF